MQRHTHIGRRDLFKMAAIPVLAAGAGWRIVQAAGMKVYVQWAQATPGDWVLADTGNWPNRQTKADPIGDVGFDLLNNVVSIGDVLLNNQAGWVFGINCQGVVFPPSDHFAVEPHVSGGAVVTRWDDDPYWYPNGDWKFADVWTFEPLAFDPKVGTVNTRQSRVFYGDLLWEQYWIDREGELPPFFRPLSFFEPPASAVTKHGIWLSDAKVAEHMAARGLRGWREWGV